MARGKDTSPQRVGPSFKGRFYQYKRGDTLVTAAWPRPRGAPRSEAQRVTQIRWKCVCWAIKALPAETQNLARESVQYSPFLPRDILVSALYGRGPVIFLPDGSRIRNLATTVNMSEVLDNIGWHQGSILYRDANLWQEVLAPDTIKYLAYDPDQKKPVWVEGGGSGGGPGVAWNYQGGGVASGSAYNAKGIKVRFSLDTLLSAVMAPASFPAANTYRISVYELNSSNVITAVLGRTTLQENPAAAPIILTAPIDPPVLLEAEKIYGITVEVTNQGTTYVNPIATANGQKNYVPWIYDSVTAIRMTKVTPVVGDTFDAPAGDPFKIALGVTPTNF